MSFKKFLFKHSGELAAIATVVSDLVALLPIGRQDKERIGKTVTDLSDAADRIAKSAEKLTDATAELDRDTLKSLIAEVLPDMIGGLIEQQTRQSARTASQERAATKRAKQAPKVATKRAKQAPKVAKD